MPDFVPFRALRFAGASAGGDPTVDLSTVCSPPYDVIDPDQRDALAASDPHNMVRLILPARYEDASAALAAWQADGTLARDDTPSFSVYRMTFTGDRGATVTTTGVIGLLALEPGGVLPHERTLPKAKSDRLELLRATRANLEPVWGISLAPGLTSLLASTRNGAPLARARDEQRVVHELFRVDETEHVDAIRDAVSRHAVVLADGHHRYETSCTYREERPDGDTAAESILMLVVELTDDQLCVRAIHRLLHGVADVDLRGALAPWFRVVDAGSNTAAGVAALEARMNAEGGLGLVDRTGLALLQPTAALADAVSSQPSALRDVDSARFDAGVVPAVPGVTLTYRNDAGAVAALVAGGAADAAVLLRPVGVDAIRAAAADGVRMPEKTTFFAPKPRTGMVLRTLDD